MAERLSRMLTSAIRAALHTAEMEEMYWPLAFQDAIYKYNMRVRSQTGRPPLHEWLGADKTPKKLFIFGPLGVIHLHSPTKTKLEYRGNWTRYVHPVDRKRIMTMDRNGSFRIVRAVGFHP